jgi:integrase
LHKPTGQAVVTLDGRDLYLGKHGSPESRAEYDRLVSEWLANGRRLPRAGGAAGTDLTVTELVVAYVKFADGYYVKNGRPTKEAGNIRLALRPLRRLYGPTPAREFGPLALKAVRGEMVRSGLCRTEVNKRVRHVTRCFRWAVAEELVPPSVHHGLKAVSGLRRGRTEARESEPVRPVPDAFVEAIRPQVSRQVWALIELQRLTGMRPGEACLMRTADLDTSGRVWVYTPAEHKTEHHGKERTVYLGPRAQAVVKPWLRTDLTAYLFSPAEAMEEYRAGLRRARRTPMTPSQAARKRKRKPKKAPGPRYTTESYGRAIAAACKRAGVPHWHPHQIRHSAATWLRKEFGLDVSRVILGHSSPVATEVYAEVDREKALAVMERVG